MKTQRGHLKESGKKGIVRINRYRDMHAVHDCFLREDAILTLRRLSQTLCLSMSFARVEVLKSSVPPSSAKPTTVCTATPSIKKTNEGRDRIISLALKKGAFSAFILCRRQPQRETLDLTSLERLSLVVYNSHPESHPP